MKTCLKCNKNLASHHFYRNNYRYDGLENYCKKCYGSQYNNSLRFSFDIIKKICDEFNSIKFLCGIPLIPKYTLNTLSSNKLIYLCVSGTTNEILKVGQTTNWKNRSSVYIIAEHSPVTMYFFEVNSWEEQNELESQIRIFLEDIGYILPWDNSGSRLNHMKL
jgi:hypothetical protein